MVFPLREEQQDGLIDTDMCHYAFDAHDQLLTDDIGYQMLLGRMDVIGNPKNADPLEKGKNDMVDRFVDAFKKDIIIQLPLEPVDIQVDHKRDQFIDDPFLLGILV